MRSTSLRLFSLSLALSFEFQARGAKIPYEFSRQVYQCQYPLVLVDFPIHIRHNQGHRAIRWDFRALTSERQLEARISQLSLDAVSPGGTLEFGGQCEVRMKAMTMERKWLEALRGSEAIDILSNETQILLWLNESYHIFGIEKNDLCGVSTSDPLWPAIANGAYVFTNAKAAFLIGKDQRNLVACPKLDKDQKPGEIDRKRLMAEILQFMQDPKIRRFFECERLLGAKKPRV